MKAGFKTTEFLIALIPVGAGLFMLWQGVSKGQPQLIDAGMTMVTGGSVGYGISRGVAKLKTPDVTPAPEPKAAPKTEEEAADVLGGIS